MKLGVARREALAQLFELGGADLLVPGELDAADALEELGGVGLGEVALGVSLHVHDAQLHVGLGEEALGDREQAREVVLDDEEHAAQAPLDEAAQDELPVLEILPPWPGDGS